MSLKQVDPCNFLVDANLPRNFRFFHSDQFIREDCRYTLTEKVYSRSTE